MGASMGRTLLSWLHLSAVAVAIVLLKVTQSVITGFYHIFPFKTILDSLWRRSRALRELFSRRLGGTLGGSPLVMTAPELIASEGYPVEVHHCITEDGFVIGLHRIPSGRSQGTAASPAAPTAQTPESKRVYAAVGRLGASEGKPAVLLVHGLMMCSDVWVVSGRERSLAFVLADAGYDVFLGNNRGNKYSSKHTSLNYRDKRYWDFSIDELARFDVPAMVNYILHATGQRQCAIIGFSQGTAQTFAALSQDHLLTSKVSAFVALSPAVAVKGLSRSSVAALVSANEDFIYLVFGRRRIFPSTLVWQRILSTDFYVRVIDASLRYLFNWDVANIADARKPLLYNHIYSYSSVKSVVHWFQIIRAGTFQMFDDAPSHHRVPPQYDVRNITTVPVALFMGLRDTIIDPPRLVSMLPPTTAVHYLKSYEHLCPMWSETAHVDVYPHVLAHLDKHCRGPPPAVKAGRPRRGTAGSAGAADYAAGAADYAAGAAQAAQPAKSPPATTLQPTSGGGGGNAKACKARQRRGGKAKA